MSRIKAALFFSFMMQQSTLLINFIAIVIIARFITPSELGVFAITNVFLILATEVRSFGVTQYLIKAVDLTSDTIRTAFGIMVISCWFLAISIFIGAPLLADFYNEPDVKPLLRIFSLTLVLAPFASIPFSIMTREVRFDLLFRIKIISGISRAFVSITLVILGYSYFGLAWGVLAGSIIELAAITYYDRSRNIYKPSLTEWRNILGFGATTSTAGLLRRISESLPDLVLGKVATFTDVGYFSRGLGLMNFLNQIVTKAVKPVVLPFLSEINRAQGDVGKAYLRCVSLHGAIAIPAFAVTAVVSLQLIQLFFGDQWDVAAPIASALSFWAIFRTIHGFLPDALIATGNERTDLKKEFAIISMRFIAVIASAKFGILAVAIGITVSGFFEFLLCSYIVGNRLKVSYLSIVHAFSKNALIALACYILVSVFVYFTHDALTPLVTLLLASAIAFLTWLVTLKLLRHELWDMMGTLLANFKSRIKSKLINRNKL